MRSGITGTVETEWYKDQLPPGLGPRAASSPCSLFQLDQFASCAEKGPRISPSPDDAAAAAQSHPLSTLPSDDNVTLGPLQQLSARDSRPPKLAFPLRERFGMGWHDIFGEERAPRLPHFQRPPLSVDELMMYSANNGLASSLSRGVKVQNQPPRLLSLLEVEQCWLCWKLACLSCCFCR